MRAVAFSDFGVAPKIHELPVPEPGPGEVLVRVSHSSINGFDVAVAAGMVKGMMEHRFPVVLGKDFAGTVERVGERVDDCHRRRPSFRGTDARLHRGRHLRRVRGGPGSDRSRQDPHRVWTRPSPERSASPAQRPTRWLKRFHHLRARRF